MQPTDCPSSPSPSTGEGRGEGEKHTAPLCGTAPQPNSLPQGERGQEKNLPPARGIWSVLILLALVLAITTQLVTGFIMMAAFGTGLLYAHLVVGLAAIVLTVAEWLWLLAAPAGRYRLRHFFAPGSTPAEWSEAAFLIVASITVVFGALLAAAMYTGLALPFAAFLTIHRALAITVAVLYIVHSAFAMRRSRHRRLLRRKTAT